MLTNEFVVMAREIEYACLSEKVRKAMHGGGWEYGTKMAEMITYGLIDALSETGKRILIETHKAAMMIR